MMHQFNEADQTMATMPKKARGEFEKTDHEKRKAEQLESRRKAEEA